MDRDGIVSMIRDRVPALLAVYAFGSRIGGGARPDSDLDLAVLVDGPADPLDCGRSQATLPTRRAVRSTCSTCAPRRP